MPTALLRGRSQSPAPGSAVVDAAPAERRAPIATTTSMDFALRTANSGEAPAVERPDNEALQAPRLAEGSQPPSPPLPTPAVAEPPRNGVGSNTDRKVAERWETTPLQAGGDASTAGRSADAPLPRARPDSRSHWVRCFFSTSPHFEVAVPRPAVYAPATPEGDAGALACAMLCSAALLRSHGTLFVTGSMWRHHWQCSSVREHCQVGSSVQDTGTALCRQATRWCSCVTLCSAPWRPCAQTWLGNWHRWAFA